MPCRAVVNPALALPSTTLDWIIVETQLGCAGLLRGLTAKSRERDICVRCKLPGCPFCCNLSLAIVGAVSHDNRALFVWPRTLSSSGRGRAH
jgi:hypothetical protein